MIKFKPLNNSVILKVVEDDEQQHGNIIIPDMGKEKPLTAKVIAAGPGQFTLTGTLLPTVVKPEDIVLIPKFGAVNIKINNEEYISCKENDIITILENE